MRKIIDLCGLLLFVLGLILTFLTYLGYQAGVIEGIFVWLAAGLALLGLAISWTSSHKECPDCGERIKSKALKCRYCGASLK